MALIEMEGRWSYVAAADDGSPKNHGIFEDRVDDARAFRTELEAEFAIKSKRLVEYQEEILKQLSVMETDLAALNAEKRNVMTPLLGLGIQIDADDFLPRLGMENDGDYYRTHPVHGLGRHREESECRGPEPPPLACPPGSEFRGVCHRAHATPEQHHTSGREREEGAGAGD